MQDHWIKPLVDGWGLWGLGADIFLESMGLPLPGETLLVFAAGLAASGHFPVFAVGLVGFAAAVLGDNTGYLLGRRFGRPLILARGSRFGITPQRLEKVEHLLEHRGMVVVVFARFVVLARQLNGLAAGTVGMHWLRFAAAQALGAALWVTAWTWLAYNFGANLHLLPALWHHAAGLVVLVPVLVLLSIAAWWRWGRAR